jgi:hypothetical protein
MASFRTAGGRPKREANVGTTFDKYRYLPPKAAEFGLSNRHE